MQYKVYLTAIISFLAYLMGGYDMGVQVLLIMIALDYITGMLKAIVLRELNSYIGWRGLCKKTGLLICVMVAVQIECLIGQPGTIHNVVAFAICVNEGVSIVENLVGMGIDVPDFLVKYIKRMKDKEDKKGW